MDPTATPTPSAPQGPPVIEGADAVAQAMAEDNGCTVDEVYLMYSEAQLAALAEDLG